MVIGRVWLTSTGEFGDMENTDVIAVDIETTGLDARNNDVRVVSIDGDVYDLWEGDYVKDEVLARLDSEATFLAHNAVFDLDFLQENLGYVHEGPIFDTLVAYQILSAGKRYTNGQRVSAGLGQLCKVFLGIELDKSQQAGGWGGMFLTENQLHYAAQDTAVLHPLYEELNTLLDRHKLRNIFDLEMQLLPVLLQMKRKGVNVDYERADALMQQLEKEAEHQQLYDLPYNLNARSSQQITAYFGIDNAQEDKLRELAPKNPTAAKVMEIKKKRKKASSIKKQIIGHKGIDGRVHPSYPQTFTETGRLSSRDPNAQNVDAGKDVRSLFVPSEGNKMVIADYAQLEVRLAAFFAGEESMLRAFWDGEDFHSKTCASIFGEETKKTRTLSKNILFASLFGGGYKNIIKFAAKSGVEISDSEAYEFQQAFFATYPLLRKWHQKQGDTKTGAVYTELGRRCYVETGEGYSKRINHVVQGSAADGMKIALIKLARHGKIPVLTVHDEVVLDVPVQEADDVARVLRHDMILGMYEATRQDPANPTVPIEVDVDVANNWSEKS